MDIFSARLKWLRERNNLTQADMAKNVNMSRPGYTKIEQGQREPNLETLVALAGALSESLDFMLGRIHYDRRSKRFLTRMDEYKTNIGHSRHLINQLLAEEEARSHYEMTIESNLNLITKYKEKFNIAKNSLLEIYSQIPGVPDSVITILKNDEPE